MAWGKLSWRERQDRRRRRTGQGSFDDLLHEAEEKEEESRFARFCVRVRGHTCTAPSCDCWSVEEGGQGAFLMETCPAYGLVTRWEVQWLSADTRIGREIRRRIE